MQDLASQQALAASEFVAIDRVTSESFASFAASTRAPICCADRYASPGLADAWAQAIITSWRAAYAVGQLDPSQPLYVIDLAPDGGHLARLLLRALRHHLASFLTRAPVQGEERDEGPFDANDDRPASSASMRPWTIRYLACIAPGSSELQVDDEHFDTISWSPLDDHVPRPSNHHAYRWHETANPVIVLALNYLQAFPGQLRAVHDGQWLEGCMHVTVEDESGCELEYDWQAITDDDPHCPALLRQRYLRTLSNSCVLIPDIGLRALQHIAELTRGRFLWLAVDQGVIDEKQLRFGAMSPPSTWSYEAQPIPVNFHAIAYDQARQGAWCWHGQPHEDGMVVQAIWRHDAIRVAHDDHLKVVDHLRLFQPDDAMQLETLACALTPASPASLHLALLRSSYHDPRVLYATLAAWQEHPPEFTDAERSYWGDAIEYAWRVCPHGDDEADLRHNMAVFAVQLGRLDIARTIFEHERNWVCVARCYARGGRLDLALSCLEGLDDPNADVLRSDLQWRMARWDSLGWYHTESACDVELCLVPLDESHAQELYEQYRDPQIGELTRLPDMETPEAAREWIVEQSQEAGRATYALMHIETGLIGVVSVQIHGEDGYFYFWIGGAHQGEGFGRRAGRLLSRQAERLGLRRLFTSVYQANHRSMDALRALGFRPLPLRAMSPDDDLLFFVRDETSCSRSWDIWREGLKALLVANKSPIALAELPCEEWAPTSSCDDVLNFLNLNKDAIRN
ncbi:GNAT family N-acetyltransferase [Dyella nitratireducens]|uniref:N-acetyltransferase domain-containing protein n=1 Tax=Dyella nitratireducens TaxID=1849580 RepID=A0ABQ1FMZ2_9GAMM|nr:GNAT family N-acetyltransferase [Dyella nitratireducens]GGA20946.1 hypothetical protein GCM10010981_06310 [Dyella nitratireducens]GLQ44307.1 hypothetical protein GCM10007902_41570 [Dyella nitratireducens]